MIALPRPLKPWAKQLAIFPTEIAPVLGALAARLASLLGGWGREHARQGVPDGVGGLARRGSYERLLLTEWLLQEELPDEFVRRAVSGEHSFLERAFQDDSTARRSVVAFDVGPELLGGPRVVELALLVALAERAERLRAALEWGVLQWPPTTLAKDLNAGTVMDFVRARMLHRARLAALDAWTAAFPPSSTSELWIVGSDRLAEAAARHGASHIALSEIFDPDPTSRVRVTVRRPPPERAHTLVLELPPSRTCVQILRDPFESASPVRPAAKLRIDPTSNIVFSVDGRRLHLRGEGGALWTIGIPNSPRDRSRAPSAFTPPEGERVVAVGQLRAGKRTVIVTLGRDAAFLHLLSKRGFVQERRRHAFPPGYDPPAIPELRPLGVLSASHVCYIDGGGNLVELVFGELVIADRGDALASKAIRDGLVYVNGGARTPTVATGANVLSIAATQTTLNFLDGRYRVMIGFSVEGDLLAVSVQGEGDWFWTVHHGNTRRDREVEESLTVVGVVEWGVPHWKPGLGLVRRRSPSLVTLDASRTRIVLAGWDSDDEPIVTTKSPIIFGAASDAGPHIAYFTQSGELGVYSLTSSAIVLRLTTEAAS